MRVKLWHWQKVTRSRICLHHENNLEKQGKFTKIFKRKKRETLSKKIILVLYIYMLILDYYLRKFSLNNCLYVNTSLLALFSPLYIKNIKCLQQCQLSYFSRISSSSCLNWSKLGSSDWYFLGSCSNHFLLWPLSDWYPYSLPGSPFLSYPSYSQIQRRSTRACIPISISC